MHIHSHDRQGPHPDGPKSLPHTGRTPSRRRGRPSFKIWLAAGAFGLLILLSIYGVVVRKEALDALTATQQISPALRKGDPQEVCRQITLAATSWQRVAFLTRPVNPLLRRLGAVPRVGSDLRLAPDAIALAQAGSDAGRTACGLVAASLTLSDRTEQLTTALQAISRQPQAMAHIRTDLESAQTAWTRLAPLVATNPRLAPYRDQLAIVGQQLPGAIQALSALEKIAPDLPWLLGMDTPRRYMLVLENPFELRATGGFIGMVCTLRVEKAKPSIEGCKPSESYDVPAPATLSLPVPIARYLRLGSYFLRDANWSPDFPTTAEQLQIIWEANAQPAVDGVIGVDMYAIIPIIQATGPLTFDDGVAVNADAIVNAILERYYDTRYRDKARIAKLVPIFMERFQQLDIAGIGGIVGALRTAAAEHHIMASINRPGVMKGLALLGLDGAFPAIAGDSLRVVDSDVGYGGVNAFIDRLTHYSVALDPRTAPLTATLTLTYTNRYSPWTEAPTAQSVWGNCTDPETQQQDRSPGCYANFVRVYVPQGSTLISASGLDEQYAVDSRYGRTIFGGYLRVYPGDHRVVQFQYHLPAVKPGSLTIEKQPGTIAPPVLVEAHRGTQRGTITSSLRTDLRFTYRADAQGLVILGPSDPKAAEPFAVQAALIDGQAQWAQGQHEAAIQTWQSGGALDLALDHGRRLAALGSQADALVLDDTIRKLTASGRAAFEQVELTDAQGDGAAADTLYQEAAQHSPDNPLAQLTWAMRQVRAGHPAPEIGTLPSLPSAARRWAGYAYQVEETGTMTDTLAALTVLRIIRPDDRELALHIADILSRSGQNDAASDAYAKLSGEQDIYGLIAGARHAAIAGQKAEAISYYVQAVALAPDYWMAMAIGDGLRRIGATEEARSAYDRAIVLSGADVPEQIRPLLATAELLRATNIAEARHSYEEAQQLAPMNGYPDYALGQMVLTSGDPIQAEILFKAATTKQPAVKLFHDVLIALQARNVGASPNS